MTALCCSVLLNLTCVCVCVCLENIERYWQVAIISAKNLSNLFFLGRMVEGEGANCKLFRARITKNTQPDSSLSLINVYRAHDLCRH